MIGLSLDGPQHIHDSYRLDMGLQPMWEKVEGVAKMLLAEGVAVNAMCCITDYSSNYAEELYRYYKGLGLTWMQFIPIVETDKDDQTKAAPFSVIDEKYGQFLITLFDEGSHMVEYVEKYKVRFGCYPREILADKIYCTRFNRAWLKEKGIKLIAKPLGRPSAVQNHISPGECNPIEGKFG